MKTPTKAKPKARAKALSQDQMDAAKAVLTLPVFSVDNVRNALTDADLDDGDAERILRKWQDERLIVDKGDGKWSRA